MSTFTNTNTPANGAELVQLVAAAMNACDIPKLQRLFAPNYDYGLLPYSLGRPPVPAHEGVAMFALLEQMVLDFHVGPS
jgi:hypothetical protein